MKSGDILLVKGDSKFSSSLVATQRLLYPQASSSHVEISVGDGTFVHSTNDGGVHLTFIEEEAEKCLEGWRVIRLRGLTDHQKESITVSSLHYLRQGYNKHYMGRGNDHSSFCSELAAKIYKKSEINIMNNLAPSKVAPYHFDMAADQDQQWDDVTHEYELALERFKNDEEYRLACRHAYEFIDMKLRIRHQTSNARSLIFDMLSKTGSEKTKAGVEEIKKKFREERKLSFWDENDDK